MFVESGGCSSIFLVCYIVSSHSELILFFLGQNLLIF